MSPSSTACFRPARRATRPSGRCRQPDGAQRLRRGPDRRSSSILGLSDDHGRNFDEGSLIDSLQLTANQKWRPPSLKQGEDVIIAGSVTDGRAKNTYPLISLESPKPYIPDRAAAAGVDA